LNGKQDAFGFVPKDFSLKSLKGNCLDFEEEETLLQSMGREMGVLVDRTPKCHCELAGEGIDYSWGCAKNFYGRVSLKRKRVKRIQVCGVREHVNRKSVNNKKDKTFFKASKTIYMCILQDLERSGRTTT